VRRAERGNVRGPPIQSAFLFVCQEAVKLESGPAFNGTSGFGLFLKRNETLRLDRDTTWGYSSES